MDDGFGDRNVPRVPDGYQEHHDGFGGWLMAVRAMVLLVWKVEQWLSRKRYVVNGGKSMKRVLLCMILIGSIFQVSAQDQGGITGRLVEIMRIEDPVQRLEAYDAFTASLLPSVDAEGTGKWQVSLDIDDMTDETRRYVILAEEDNRPSYNRVFLVIRDLGQGVEVFINWNDYLADNTTTILRFGSEAAESGYRWSSSSDSTALFLRSSSRSEFLRRLSEVERLVARVTPYNDGPKTAVFDVRRILQALEAAGMQIDGP